MIAKLLVHGADRQQVLERSNCALTDFDVAGIPTTLSFHRKLVNHPAFRNAEIHTKWLDEIGSI